MLRLCSKSSRSYPGRSVRHAPKRAPKEWVVDCTHVGKGISALKYLSRYLYRGVISEKNIVSNQNGQVTFKYIESKTGNTLYRTLKDNAIWHKDRGGFFAPHLTTCAAKRISEGQGLWVSSW